MARQFSRNASRFSRLFLRLRTNKQDATDWGDYPGQQMAVIQLPPGQTANALEIQDSTGGVPANGNVLFGVDAAGNYSYGGSPKVKACCVQFPLTAAQLIAMGTTPITIVPAPGAGFAIAVEQIAVELNLTATAFTSGGVAHFYYHGQTTEIMAQSIAAATVQGGAGQSLLLLEPAQTAGGSVVTPAVGIDITNATAPFASGTGAAIVTVWYSLLTL
jgi:hypothetical protein